MRTYGGIFTRSNPRFAFAANVGVAPFHSIIYIFLFSTFIYVFFSPWNSLSDLYRSNQKQVGYIYEKKSDSSNKYIKLIKTTIIITIIVFYTLTVFPQSNNSLLASQCKRFAQYSHIWNKQWKTHQKNSPYIIDVCGYSRHHTWFSLKFLPFSSPCAQWRKYLYSAPALGISLFFPFSFLCLMRRRIFLYSLAARILFT